jgi:hypothetical protein
LLQKVRKNGKFFLQILSQKCYRGIINKEFDAVLKPIEKVAKSSYKKRYQYIKVYAVL